MLGRQREEPLQPAAGMLGPLALKAVREQQRQAAQPPPLVLRTGDELVNDHLPGVNEVPELGLPR